MKEEYPFAAELEIEYLESDPIRARGRIRVTEDMTDMLGHVTGGIYNSLADAIGGAAARATGDMYVTQNCSMQYYVSTEEPDGKVSARLLEGPLDTSLYEGGEGCRAPNHAFPRFRDCAFKAAYPLAQVELKDAAMPVAARLEAMNPLVKGDSAASGIPTVLLRWNVRNVTAKPVKVSVMGMLVNPTGGAPFEDKDGKSIDVTKIDSNELTGVCIFADERDVCDNTCGQVAMSVPKLAGVVSRASRISDSGWMVRFDRYWKQFMATGRADDLRDLDAGRWTLPMGTVSVQVELAPGETKRAEISVPVSGLAYWVKDRLVPAKGKLRGWICRDSASGVPLSFEL